MKKKIKDDQLVSQQFYSTIQLDSCKGTLTR